MQWATGNTSLTSQMLDWALLEYGVEILGSGLNLVPDGDKIGLFPGQERGKWDLGNPGF